MPDGEAQRILEIPRIRVPRDHTPALADVTIIIEIEIIVNIQDLMHLALRMRIKVLPQETPKIKQDTITGVM